jgi:signal transduction histidine kinase
VRSPNTAASVRSVPQWFGDRDRPDEALRNLAARLGETVDPLEVPQTVVETVARALRLPFVALDRQTSTGPVRAASRGSEPTPGRVVVYPIGYGGERLAALLVAPRAGEDTVTAADRAVLADLAAQAGPALYAGRLAQELADSRERLRQGRLDERAHLRRALHDGVSPTLSGIAIAAAAARGRDPADPAVRRLLTRIEEEAGAGATSLRAQRPARDVA